MEISKEEFAAWVEEFGHSDEWVAAQCFVTPRTVANWRTSKKRSIPQTQVPTILRLMKQDSDKAQNLLIEGLTMRQFRAMNKKARDEDKNSIANDWAKKVLIAQLKEEDYEDWQSSC